MKLPLFTPDAPLFLIAGPCALESRQHALEIAEALKSLSQTLNLPFIFKASYDKANRTSGHSLRGLGLQKGLSVLAEVRQSLDIPIITDVHLPENAAEVAAVADVLQIPAFLCRQTDLIQTCATMQKPMLIKKGQFLAPEDMLPVVEKARNNGAPQILVCERGTSFGYHDLVVDMRSLVWMRKTACPVVFDATHSVQLPGGEKDQSGGVREMVPPLLRAAVGVGVEGIFIETHPNPEKAISDRFTQWPLKKMPDLLKSVLAIDEARRTVQQ